ncbi:reverse transcriptase domain-containing protein [Tanacetum coccineum]
MSSPNHLTSGIEDAFSSNFPDFIPASPDYVPASPGKTYSSSSNSFGVVPMALPTLSLFHDDPYMKVMQAFYAKKSPIPPPTIIPQSSMLNPQEFFLPEELLPTKKRGESSRKTSLERHEEQIEEILNHLDELSLDRIEYIEDKIEGLRKGRVIIQQDFDNMEAELQQARAQITKLQKNQMENNYKISLARFRITDLEHIINDIQIRHQEDKESLLNVINELKISQEGLDKLEIRSYKCTEENKVTFAIGTLTDDALSWWNAYAQPMGVDQANQITWTELKRLLTNKYCPRTEVRKMEDELYNLTIKGNDLKPYVRRFQELAVLCPNMVPNTEKLLEAFIGGLPRSIEGNVTASKPQTLEEAINIAQRLMDQYVPPKPVLARASDEELEAPIEDQLLPADASPTALSPGYIVDSNPEEDAEDPEEDPADYPVDEGDNVDNESSDDDNDDDDVEKDEKDKEEEHLAPTDPSVVPIDDLVP